MAPFGNIVYLLFRDYGSALPDLAARARRREKEVLRLRRYRYWQWEKSGRRK
jgi:hypothetical protein